MSQFYVEQLNEEKSLLYLRNLEEGKEEEKIDFNSAIFEEVGYYEIPSKVVLPKNPFLREQAKDRFLKTQLEHLNSKLS